MVSLLLLVIACLGLNGDHFSSYNLSHIKFCKLRKSRAQLTNIFLKIILGTNLFRIQELSEPSVVLLGHHSWADLGLTGDHFSSYNSFFRSLWKSRAQFEFENFLVKFSIFFNQILFRVTDVVELALSKRNEPPIAVS